MTTNLTTRQLLHAAARALASVSDTPQLDAEVLLAHVLGGRRARLQAHPDEERSDAEQLAFQRLIDRRATGEPVAYIVGYREFWSLRVAVSRAALVPRPETEILVERALKLGTAPTLRALDLGTGAGTIALALGHERPRWQVTGTDISEAALALARVNALALGTPQLEFLHGRWFEPLGGRIFDLIVSNPPYVAEDDPLLSQAPLSFEPRIALTPGVDALADLRRIVRQAPAHLARGGWLLLEHGTTQAG
ncbi:MAG TPA: peptide chain release factor N(5)-glutamine methyltransferase, partial [Steroidobacteraceae bacterium]